MIKSIAGLKFLFTCFISTFVLCGTVSHLIAQSKPSGIKNVIFILSDDHRYDFMSFMEQAPHFLDTPAMDRMAREGAHLKNTFVTTSLCSPSRASILTGQYAHRHGVVDNQRLVPEGTRFFPEFMQQEGFETAFVGKWHMGHERDDPRPGFDHWVSTVFMTSAMRLKPLSGCPCLLMHPVLSNRVR